MEKLDFIKMMLSNRYLSINDKKRLLNLATHEIEAINSSESDYGQEQQPPQKEDNKNKPHKPKDTAIFLSLFRNPNGFKYLTHDYDPDMTVEDRDYDNFMNRTRDVFKKETKNKKIPQSLWRLMDTILNGGKDDNGVKTWLSCDGRPQNENYACDRWVEWARNNPGAHLLTNGDFVQTINLFRSTVRVVRPALQDIVDEISTELREKYPDLDISTQRLDRADFYTYVFWLKGGIDRILRDMCQRINNHPQINISFNSEYGDDFSTKIIRITQIGAEADPLESVIENFKNGGGAFNEISTFFRGFCNWSVEAIWDGVPKRWNILDDTDRLEVEELDIAQIEGFTHILTYYYK